MQNTIDLRYIAAFLDESHVLKSVGLAPLWHTACPKVGCWLSLQVRRFIPAVHAGRIIVEQGGHDLRRGYVCRCLVSPCPFSRVPLLFIHAQIQIREIQERRRDLMNARALGQMNTHPRRPRRQQEFSSPSRCFLSLIRPDVLRLKAS